MTLVILVVTGLIATPAQAEDNATQPLTKAQLEQLVAPIALHPDPLLSQILMASTYPLEVVEASRWSKENPNVTGQALQDAMQKQSWDPSVKALTAVPQTLQMMNDEISWTQQLGDAFLGQQKDVLDAVQALRARADASGNLQSTPQQKVTKTSTPPPSVQPSPSGAARTVYTIEPAVPDEYYVPIYNPTLVYGDWPYPAYEPFYWYPPGYVAGNVLSFGAGVAVGWAIWGNTNWWNNRVDINVNRYNRFNHTDIRNNNWAHNPAHRGTVPYRDANVERRYGDQAKQSARESFRGKSDAGRNELTKQGKGGDQRDAAKTGGKAKSGAQSKSGAKSKSGATSKSATSTKKTTKTKQSSQKKQTTQSKQAGKSQGSRQKAATTHRPSAGGTVGSGARAQKNVGRSGGGAGGGARSKGGGGGRRR
jgi:hypothetical protein